jgi:dienelactone hydrolase
MRIKFYPICFAACLLLSLKTFSQLTYYTGAYGTLTEKPNTPINEMIGGYMEVLPPDYNSNTSKKYPLLIFLEGQSQFGNGDTTELRSLYGNNEGMLAEFIKNDQFPNNYTVGAGTFQFIVIIPQIRDQVRNRPSAQAMASPTEVNDIINYAMQNYRVDPTRVYLSGLSLGGGSTWNYPGASVAYASRLAAIVPLEGASNLWDDHSRVSNIAAANLAVWTLTADDHPFDTLAQRYIDSIKTHPEHTADAIITIYPGGTHNSWGIPLSGQSTNPPPGERANIYEWMLEQSSSATQPVFAVVNAGVDQILNLLNGSMVLGAHGISFNGATVSLSGSVSPNIGQSIEWRRVIGNGGTITSPNSLNTTVSDLKPGFYVFQLRVTDNQGLVSVDNVSVTVNAPPDNKYAKIEAEAYSGRTPGADYSTPTTDKTSIDEGAAYSVGWFYPGTWVEYNLNRAPGKYALYYRYNSPCCSFPSINILSNGNVVATRTLSSSSAWVADSIQINLGANTTIRFQAENWNFNYFELAQLSAESALPVKFVYFNTQCTSGSVKVQWSTALEQNSKDFSVQKSTDGVNWSEIGRVAAEGQSGQQKNYAFEDKGSVGSGMYRIVEFGINGEPSISSIVRSNCSLQETISLYPNPTLGRSALNVNVEQPTALSVLVLDSRGALMQQSQIQLPSGNSIVPLNMSIYPKGVYTVNVRFNNKVKTFKLIKNQ